MVREWAVGLTPNRAEAYWALEQQTLLAQLRSGRTGLTEREARRRLASRSELSEIFEGRHAWLLLIGRQFKNPLVVILLLVSVCSMLLSDWVEAAVVLGIVLMSTSLGFSQEFIASRAFERLARRAMITAMVLRDHRPRRIAAHRVVPGDVVLLEPGSRVPADGVVLSNQEFFVNQSALTGEAFAVTKRAGPVSASTALGQRSNVVFMGSSVESGTAQVLAVSTGRETVFGRIVEQLAEQAGPNEFERGISAFGRLLMQTMLMITLTVLAIHVVLDRPAVEALMFALALAVGLTPELLPAIISVMLARGAHRLADQGVIVRKLNAIESLGGMTVMCTDKTGTLTSGQVILEIAIDTQGQSSAEVLRFSALNAALQGGVKNPIDDAIVTKAKALDIPFQSIIGHQTVPFDYSRKCVSVGLLDSTLGPILITKGAFGQVLDRCVFLDHPDKQLTTAARASLLGLHDAWAQKGYRILAVATRRLTTLTEKLSTQDEQELCFVGLLCFIDPPKHDTADMVRALAERGVQLKMITGDDRQAALHTARSVGLSAETVITGGMLISMSDQELTHAAVSTSVFAEVDPSQKERIVRALQRSDEVVGFLGDGVNDALALHTADVGLSVHNAVDVAREASDFVLLRKELRLICDGIDEGRRTFANTMKYILSTTSANFGNMVSMGLISLVLPFLPLLPAQILLNNFLSDIPSAALSGDLVERESAIVPQRFELPMIRNAMIFFGLISVIFDLALFGLLFWVIELTPEVFRTAWFVESLLTELAVLFVIRSRAALWKSRPSAGLVIASIVVAAIALLLPVSPLAGLFEFQHLPAWLTLIIIGITLLYAASVEVAKRWFFRKSGHARGFSVSCVD
ncbi:MAG: magnesium-translocating P-type ATPase [Betaproteobacteria bacterium]|nr:magnesium-translocating P-type ATPase [Betaproteobacteria bacterium]